jgi:hypothetical protein
LPKCFVDLPVYGPTGHKLAFTVEKITRADNDKSFNFLVTKDRRYRMVIEGSRLYFSDEVPVGAVFELTLRDDRGATIKRPLALMACQQRTSLEEGEVETGDDVSASGIAGRVVGCQLEGDWWMRAMPMFGGHWDTVSYEGYVNQTDGAFSLNASLRGTRHIVVFGRGRQPVKALGVDLVEGRQNDIGVIDLSDSCPPSEAPPGNK